MSAKGSELKRVRQAKKARIRKSRISAKIGQIPRQIFSKNRTIRTNRINRLNSLPRKDLVFSNDIIVLSN